MSGCYTQDFPKSNKHCSWHDGERQGNMSISTKIQEPFSLYQFLFNGSSLSLQLFPALHLCLKLNSTLPTISLWEEANKMQHNPNISKSMNGNRIKGIAKHSNTTVYNLGATYFLTSLAGLIRVPDLPDLLGMDALNLYVL